MVDYRNSEVKMAPPDPSKVIDVLTARIRELEFKLQAREDELARLRPFLPMPYERKYPTDNKR